MLDYFKKLLRGNNIHPLWSPWLSGLFKIDCSFFPLVVYSIMVVECEVYVCNIKKLLQLIAFSI
jgi:hypothetical protein